MSTIPTRFDGVPLPLTTPRLRLRPPTGADREAVWAYRNLPEVRRYLGPYPTDAEAFAPWFRTRHDPAAGTVWLLVECEGQVVGDVTLGVKDAPSVAGPTGEYEGSLGYVVSPAAAGRGVAFEAARAVVAMGFGPLGLRRITAEVFSDHAVSLHIMRKLGFREEGTSVAKVFSLEGTWFDDVHFALLAEEWAG